jgi:tetrahydromethanopterin S-methyltransferase subunit C
MRHLAVTTLLGAIVFTIGVLLDPPTEHPVAAVPFVGIVLSALVTHVIGVPYRTVMQLLWPQASGVMVTGVAALLWLAVIAVLAGLPAPNTLTRSGLAFAGFWWIYLTTIVTAMSWPTPGCEGSPPATNQLLRGP